MGSTTGALPDISRIGLIEKSDWADLGRRLRDFGVSEQYLSGMGLSAFASGGREALAEWHLARRREPGACVCRMFGTGDSVSESDAEEALGSNLLPKFLCSGVVTAAEPGRVVSPFRILALNGVYILCDELSQGGDAVFGGGPGTVAVCRTIPGRYRTNRALDLGCGAGTVALSIASHAGRITASDINPRALQFVELNAAINQIRNVEPRVSDLFAGLAGESFGLITAQLPFVPEPANAVPASHRFGGARGNELVLRAIGESQAHLDANGRAVFIFLQPLVCDVDPGRDIEERRRRDVCALLLLGPETDADTFSIRYGESELGRGMSAHRAAVQRMRDHLDRIGISGLCPAICVLERVGDGEGWTEVVRTTGDLWRDASAVVIDRLLLSAALLHQPAALLQARLRIRSGALKFESFPPGERTYIAGPAGALVPPFEMTPSEWRLLRSIHQAPTVGSVVNSLCESDRETSMRAVSTALRSGLFDIDPETGD